MKKQLVEEVIKLNIIKSKDVFEWGLLDREKAAKNHKAKIEAIVRWYKMITNENNRKSLLFKVVESLSSDKLSLSIALVVEFDENSPGACEEVGILQERFNLAIKEVSEVFKKIEEKNPKNPSAVRLSPIEDKKDVLLVDNNDALTLSEELRKKPRKNEKETILVTSEGAVTIAFHEGPHVLQQDNEIEKLTFKIVAFLYKKNFARGELNGVANKEFSLHWSAGGDKLLLPFVELREKLIMDMKDQRLIELRVSPIARFENGCKIVTGYKIVEYIGCIQHEM
jgi:hypothetical protein